MVEMFAYTVFSLIFYSSEKLSGPDNAGLGCFSFSYPHNVQAGNEEFLLTFVEFSPEMQQNMQMPDSELFAYAKSTFFGTSKPAESYTEREMISLKSRGEIITKKIPVTTRLELHFYTLKSGTKYCIGFSYPPTFEQEKAERMISEILSTLAEK